MKSSYVLQYGYHMSHLWTVDFIANIYRNWFITYAMLRHQAYADPDLMSRCPQSYCSPT